MRLGAAPLFQEEDGTIVKANETRANLQTELDPAYAPWSELDA